MKPLQHHPAGTRLAGKFRVLRLLGTGGMGAVYEVENERLAKRYALKVLHTDERTSPELVKRFQREIKADGHIRNAHIVEIHDDGVLDTGEPYVVMELLEGETLAKHIECKGQLDLNEICDLIGQACDGVQAAHDAGIIHRDLKPENLFIMTRDDRPFLKLLDFGIAKFQSHAPNDMKSTSKGAILGTPYYLSPEQIRGNGEIDARVDVYALGVILYECATGRVPYRADTLPLLGVLICEGKPALLGVLRPDLPGEYRNCVLQAIAVDRERRMPSARELGAALRAIGARTHAASTSLLSRSASNPLSTNSLGDLMRSTEIIEEPPDLPHPAPINEQEPQPALMPRRRFPWAMTTTLALAGISATALWIGMKDAPNVSLPSRGISSPNTSVSVSVAETSISTAAPSASVTETEMPSKTENTGPASASASASVTSPVKANAGTDRASKLGINRKLSQ